MEAGARTQAGGRGLRARDRDLIERLIQLRGERRIIGKQRKRQAEARRGLGLHQVKRLAGRVKVFFQNPVLDLPAAIGEHDLVELIFDGGGGHDGGGDLRRSRWKRCLRAAADCEPGPARLLSGRRGGLRLSGERACCSGLGLAKKYW